MITRRSQSGISLLEVLVSILVLALGILGLAALQAYAMRGGMSAEQSSQAVLVAYDMMDRIRSNRTAALAGDYNLAFAAAPPSGDGVAPLADDDLADWFSTQLGLLPSGDGEIACTTAGMCRVSVQWDDSRVDPGATARRFDFTSEI